MHPHRGIETVTYMLSGIIHHRDSLGNEGSITNGDLQWMTSGGGILHEEMPDAASGRMAGFQLWVNLPARLKMTRPRYQDIRASAIPEVRRDDGAVLRVVAGTAENVVGPVTDIAADPSYLDITLPPDTSSSFPVPRGHTAFSYVFEGHGDFDAQPAAAPSLIVWGDGDYVQVKASKSGVRFLLVSAKPLHEPVARYGPFVMNTKEEIEEALQDLRRGTFVKED
jgi:redox-sensitive bicupin YhaK (pirin superfamily)